MDSNAVDSSTGNDTSPPTKNPHRRVKVYMLNIERAWDDKGTGHVSCAYIDRLSGMALIVRSEDDENSVILESKVCPDTTYQKQQETLICWSEKEQELALSFQLVDSCSEIWEKICDVQGRDPGDSGPDDSLQDSRDDDHPEDPYAANSMVELPTPDLRHLPDIQALFNEYIQGGAVQWRVDKLSASIESEGYISKLLDLYSMCDDLENTEALHQLYSIFKTIFMLNRNSLFEILFSTDNLMKVVGVLENDPCKKSVVPHREFLEKKAIFHPVLALTNELLLDKIHQTYRVQYIQDVILPTPSVFDENLLSALNSFVFFNKCEIVKMLQDDEKMIKVMFQQLTDDETDDAARRDLVKFLKEMCTFSATLQAPDREAFFQMLAEMRLLDAIETLWNLEDADILSTTNDIFAYIVEANPSMVREFCLSEAKLGQDDLLLTKAIEQMQHDPDPELGGAVLLSVTIRLLIDPENMLANTTANGAPSMRTEKTEFLNYFYLHCMPVLITPFRAITKNPDSLTGDYYTAQLLNLTVELLSFCSEHHSYQFRVHMIKHEILKKVLCLLKSKHMFLALCAIRFLRKLINLKDDTYNRHIVQGNHLKAVCDAFLANGEKYNLFNSACIELFEYLKTESIGMIATHFVEVHYNSGFQDITYVKTFQQLKETFSPRPASSSGLEDPDSFDNMLAKTRRCRRDNNALEEEEEMWFDKDDEEEEGGGGDVTPPYRSSPDPDDRVGHVDTDPTFTLSLPKHPAKDEDEGAFTAGPKLARAISINLKSLISATDSPPRSPPSATYSLPDSSHTTPAAVAQIIDSAPSTALPASKVALVDYPDEDSDEEGDGDGLTASKRSRIEASNS
ncbi:serine/threonine-protein phosphatase 4 regulatory subunit 3A-like isoform X2 [Watersipora subatra]|uniref:serine/threonine-protein phosphatase 4 regulatory subunit 3A-like isoform X2 n=1 Tax=Watersipora subatra TaxID=2589382 RepID=UPI00355B3A9B